jgi:predicted lipoprotein with Yx(FWY)xxD motif
MGSSNEDDDDDGQYSFVERASGFGTWMAKGDEWVL